MKNRFQSLPFKRNLQRYTTELLDYLAVADPEFKSDLTRRIALLVTRFAPDRRWHVDTLVELLVQGGSYVADEECRSFIQLITATPELQVGGVCFGFWGTVGRLASCS